MAEVRHLEHAPIVEAIVDIRVTPSASFQIGKLDLTDNDIPSNYSEKSKILTRQFRLSPDEDSENLSVDSQDADTVGFKYKGVEGNPHIFQFRRNGFSISRLEPYQDWQNLADEAKRIWRIYSDIADPQEVTRVSVRYINRVTLPLPIDDLDDFLNIAPRVPPELPQNVVNFFNRFTLYEKEQDANCVITLALEGTSQQTAPILFDIDIIRRISSEPADVEIWEYLEGLRHLKNSVFFKGLTDKTVRMYQ